MTIPPRFSLRSMLAFARHPLWCWNILVRRPVKLANFAGQRAEPGSTLLNFINSQFEPKLSRSEEHTSELQSLMRISYAVFCLKKNKQNNITRTTPTSHQHINTHTTIRHTHISI